MPGPVHDLAQTALQGDNSDEATIRRTVDLECLNVPSHQVDMRRASDPGRRFGRHAEEPAFPDMLAAMSADQPHGAVCVAPTLSGFGHVYHSAVSFRTSS